MARHRWATSPPSHGGITLPGNPIAHTDALVDSGTVGRPAPLNADQSCEADEPGAQMHNGGRRWAVGRGAALAALGLALVVAVTLFVVRGGASPEVSSVELGLPGDSQPAQSGSGTSRGTPPSVPTPPAGKSPGALAVETAPAPPAVEGTGQTVEPGQTEPPGRLLVHVAGAVNSPGIVELSAGSRVFEAVDLAGGALPKADLTAINLAAPVEDGLQIRVPLQGETLAPVQPGGASVPGPVAGGPPGPPGPAGSGGTGGTGSGSTVNINTADVAELETLPRVGPVLAERIIQWRTEHGGFSTPEDLDAVPGIGEAMLAALVPLVTV